MKRLITSLALCACAAACAAAPTLAAAPYPASAPQPTAAVFTVNGGAAQACTLKTATDGSVQPVCDLASITAAGVYTLVLTVSSPGGCTNGTNAATCAAGGSASSANFSYTWVPGSVSKPVLTVAP